MDPEFTAAARYPLTVLHRRADGWTLCGMPMLPEELWVPVEYRGGDVICWVCEGEYRGCTPAQAVQAVQGTLL